MRNVSVISKAIHSRSANFTVLFFLILAFPYDFYYDISIRYGIT